MLVPRLEVALELYRGSKVPRLELVNRNFANRLEVKRPEKLRNCCQLLRCMQTLSPLMDSEFSATVIPRQILRPAPYGMVLRHASDTLALMPYLCSMKRSGMNDSGSSNTAGSCRAAHALPGVSSVRVLESTHLRPEFPSG